MREDNKNIQTIGVHCRKPSSNWQERKKLIRTNKKEKRRERVARVNKQSNAHRHKPNSTRGRRTRRRGGAHASVDGPTKFGFLGQMS